MLRKTLLMVTCLLTLAGCIGTRSPDSAFGLRASADSDFIERGRYLVYGPAHCAACHGDPARDSEMRDGHEVPLSGGRTFDLGVGGTIIAPNITSDVATGIGALSDDVLVRSLRYGISRHGRPLAPFMSLGDLSDADLRAVLSFLRQLPPVTHATPESRLSWLGAFGIHFLVDPQGPSAMPPKQLTPARSAEYGRYLANAVANCRGCHTLRSKLTGAFTGTPFAGGMKLSEGGHTFTTPNLTSATGGVIANCGERDFIARFRVEGRGRSGSPMPWGAFARMTDDDLGAIYRYLRSLPPAPMPDG